jgi:hypothetical protein
LGSPEDFRLRRNRTLAVVLACCVLAVACGRQPSAGNATATAGDDAASLPKPESKGGPVTGMPATPGPGPIGPPGEGATTSVAPLPVDDGTLPLPPPDASPAGDGSLPAMPPGEPTPEDAAAVVDGYYAAIAAGQYPRAYALWSGEGQASGQTPQQFAAGFADTASVSVDVGAPGRVDAAAGSRYVEIPVTVTAIRKDGSVHRYAGAYTLRRAVVDGATATQRAWRIASADLREVHP